jgi:hypothetical protein
MGGGGNPLLVRGHSGNAESLAEPPRPFLSLTLERPFSTSQFKLGLRWDEIGMSVVLANLVCDCDPPKPAIICQVHPMRNVIPIP